MNNYNNKKQIVFENIKDFDLAETFECGQCFRWNPHNDEYEGVSCGKEAHVNISNGNLIISVLEENPDKEFWEKYFDVNLDYQKVKDEIKDIHPVLKEACKYAPGIRILNQEPWETLCSFIISQNNNIPRIKGIIHRLCEIFGEKIENNYSFPSAEKIALLSEEDLKPLRCGFRVPYILDAAKKVSNREVDLLSLKNLPLEDARKELIKIHGVGPKVAECTLLYGLHRLDAFPIDVWMKKIMNKFFKNESPQIFGRFAGIAQQYLFHYIRMNPKLLEE